MCKGRRGFTLIELLIVVVIIGILATIVMAKFGEARERAARNVVKASLRDLTIQQELAHHATGSYVGGAGPADFVPTPDVTINIGVAAVTGWAATATHPLWSGKKCGIYVGSAPQTAGAPATTPGQIACDP